MHTERPGRRRAAGTRGRVIVVAGPDGSGKTQVAEELLEAAAGRGPVVHLHHRPRVLPGLTHHDGPVTDPHRQRPYPSAISAIKLLYLHLDYLLGWLLRMGPVRRAGGTVVLERGWWDLAVDPRRYRLTPLPMLHRTLAWLQPRPDRTIVLDAPVEVLLERKQELPLAELERQRQAWRALARRGWSLTMWDARQRPSAIVPLVFTDVEATAVDDDRAGPTADAWVALPTSRIARWVVPRRPRRAARSSLRIHRPVSGRALAGWSLGYAAATMGALRFASPVRPAAWIVDRVADLVPSGGTLATARSNHTGRALVMILDHRADLRFVVKVSSDAEGAAQLEREAVALQRFGPVLEPPLTAPRLHRADPGRLVLAPVQWQLQLTPWKLDPSVAGALGRFHARGREPDGTGYGHGDVAPWNLLRTSDGWCLVDWESAGSGHLPFDDLFHFLVQGHALLGHPTTEAILHGLDGGGWIGACLRAYADAAGVYVHTAEEHLQRYLTSTEALLDLRKVDARRGAVARRELLERLAAHT
jgi:RecA/RadA recombinase